MSALLQPGEIIKRFIGAGIRNGVRNSLRVSRRLALEDDEHAEVFVRREAVVGTGLDEDGTAFLHRNLLPLDLEHTAAFEDDVDLVVHVGLLAVGLGCDQNVDAQLEAGGLVEDLVSSAGLG